MHLEGRRKFIGTIFGITDKGVDGTLGENISEMIGMDTCAQFHMFWIHPMGSHVREIFHDHSNN